MALNPYFHALDIRCMDQIISEKYYDKLFDTFNDAKIVNPYDDKNILNFSKNVYEETIVYWGNYYGAPGLRLTQIKNTTYILDPEFRTGLMKFSLFVPHKKIVDKIYQEMSELGSIWEPQSFDYSPGYYSCCLKDPDGIHIEINYMD